MFNSGMRIGLFVVVDKRTPQMLHLHGLKQLFYMMSFCYFVMSYRYIM